MTPERWQQVKDIFDRAVDRGPASRMAYIGERCGEDEELRREVESLLNSDTETGSLLDNPLIETVAGASPASNPGAPSAVQNDSFGPYAPVRVLGEGGMGTVYLARQQQPIRREVALKVVKLGMDSQQVLERFEIERQALALMEHPNVARVLDAGTSERGRPYFVMEYVDGVPITQYCDGKALSTRQRLQLFIPVCNALQHAHKKGIIHRDVKPSNVLVTEVDGKPAPKVIDFGIARATEQCSGEGDTFTLSGQLIGTPEYMSPEQASVDSQDIDTGTDVYSLGVVLYELLVGALPLEIKSLRRIALAEVLRAIRETPVPKPTERITQMGAAAEGLARLRSTDTGQLKRDLAGDLDWIVMKAIDRDRHCRYASASEFGADIERFLKSEPVLAGPHGAAYRMRKFVVRHKGPAAAAAAIVLALIAGMITTTWQAIRANQERDRAVAIGREATSEKLAAYAMASLSEDPERSIILGMHAINATLQFKQRVLPAAEAVLHLALLSSQARLTLHGHQAGVGSVAFSPDGKRIATASLDKTAKLWDGATGRELFTLRGHQDTINRVIFSPDGTRLATDSDDRTAKLWDVASGRELLTFRGRQAAILMAVFSPDGKRLATASADKTTTLWDTTTGQELFTLRGRAIAFLPDGKRLATAGGNTVTLWDPITGRELLTLRGHKDEVRSVAFSSDGKRIATGSSDGTATLWDAATGRELFTLRGHQDQVRSVAFSPDGKQIATASNQTATLWNASTGRELFTLRNEAPVWTLVFSPDGKRLATAAFHGTAKVYDAATGEELFTFRQQAPGLVDVAFSPDGRRLATANLDARTATVWDLGTAQELPYLHGHQGAVNSVAFSPDGKRIGTASADKTAKVWDAATGQELFTLRGHQDEVTSVVFSPDGGRLATGSMDGTAKLWDPSTGRELFTLRTHQAVVWKAVFSPDGRRIATAGTDRTAMLWDATTGQELLTLRHQSRVRSIAFSPDGKRLATASDDKTAKVWDPVSGHELLTLTVGRFPPLLFVVNALAFSPDGKRLATAAGFPKMWDATTGRELFTFRGNAIVVTGVAFSPDGKRLATASKDKSAKVWDAVNGQELFTIRHQADVNDVAFSPDGRRLAVADDEGVQIYAMAIQDLMALARKRVTRPLNRYECRNYFQSETCPPLP